MTISLSRSIIFLFVSFFSFFFLSLSVQVLITSAPSFINSYAFNSLFLAFAATTTLSVSAMILRRYIPIKRTKRAVLIVLTSNFFILVGLLFLYSFLSSSRADPMFGLFVIVFLFPSVILLNFALSLLPLAYFKYQQRSPKLMTYLFYSVAVLDILFIVLLAFSCLSCGFFNDPACLAESAINRESPDICKKAKSLQITDECYIHIRHRTLDKTICNRIHPNSPYSEVCEQMLNFRGFRSSAKFYYS